MNCVEIKAARLMRDLTQKEAAALSGVSLHVYLNAEMGCPVAPKVRAQVAAAMQTGQQQPIYRGQGFASMDPERRTELARQGGKAAHAYSDPHQFTSAEASEAGRKGGESVSRDSGHMARIGRKGGLVRKVERP